MNRTIKITGSIVLLLLVLGVFKAYASGYLPIGIVGNTTDLIDLERGLLLDMPLTTLYTPNSTGVSDRTPYNDDGIVKNGAIVSYDYTTFDGVDDGIESIGGIYDLNISTQEFSFVYWLNCSINESTEIPLSKYGNTNGMYSSITLGQARISGRNKDEDAIHHYVNSITLVNDSKWHMITGVADGNQWSIYVDGVKERTETEVNPNLDTHVPLSLGKDTSTNYMFNGSMAGVKIYNRALSAEEVTMLYNQGVGVYK